MIYWDSKGQTKGYLTRNIFVTSTELQKVWDFPFLFASRLLKALGMVTYSLEQIKPALGIKKWFLISPALRVMRLSGYCKSYRHKSGGELLFVIL